MPCSGFTGAIFPGIFVKEVLWQYPRYSVKGILLVREAGLRYVRHFAGKHLGKEGIYGFFEIESMSLSMIASLRSLSPKPRMIAMAAPRPRPTPHAIGVTNV